MKRIDSLQHPKRSLRCESLWLVTLLALTAASTTVRAQQPLRYNLAPQQVVPYTVKIEADTPLSVETFSGVIAFTGKQQDAGTLSIQYSGGLSKSVKSKKGAGLSGPGGFGGFAGPRPGMGMARSPFDQPDYRGLTQTTSDIVLSEFGGVKSMRGDSQLPFLLGNLSLMPFDSLPADNREEWEDGNGLTITSKPSSESRFGPRFGPFGESNDEKVKTGGSESASYKITSRNGSLVTIAKTYNLSSPSVGKQDAAIKIDGSGTWIFNAAEGVSESMEFKNQMAISIEGADIKIPVTISWKRMPKEEYAAMVKAKQERQAAMQAEAKARAEKAAQAAKEKEGKPLSENEKKEMLADLNASHWPTIMRRLDSMKGFVPHPQDFDVALRVKELRSHSVLGVKRVAQDLWVKLEKVIEAAGPDAMKVASAEAKASSSDPGNSSSDENPFATDEEKAKLNAAKTMRTWSDSSGSFKVEAQFLRVDGGTVFLKRKDGAEVKVPINRLSEEDQKIIQSLK